MTRIIEQFKVGDKVVKILPDEEPQEYPFEQGAGIILAEFSRRTKWHHQFKEPDEIDDWALKNEYEAFVVYRYEHGGTGYSLDNTTYPYNCPFDAWKAGWFLIRKNEGADADERRAIAESACIQMTTWANGNYYGYVIEDENGGSLGSCWGFDDLTYCRDQAKEEAEA